MQETLAEVWISCMTLLTVYLTGNKNKMTPYCGLFSELCWALWIIVYGHWGLIPLNIGLIVLYIRMIKRWRT